MDIKDAFEQAVSELGLTELDDNLDDIPDETVDKTEDSDPEDEGAESEEPAEGEEDESESDEEVAGDEQFIEIKAGFNLKLPDGTVVPSDKAVLLQADYTRKTQELAEQRKSFESEVQEFESARQEVQDVYEQMRSWYEDRSSNPSSWIMEIASESEDATSTIAKAIYELAQAGVLDPKFVETFGIETGPVADMASKSNLEAEIAELRAWRESQQQEVSQREAVRARAAEYEKEWNEIKLQRGLDYSTKAEELAAKRELFQFAFENRITTSLVDAFDLMTVRKPKPAPAQGSDPEVANKKRASRAVTPRST
ncbi:MAG: hypothetical protein ACO395_07835, partial [Pontimonas sp.]